MSELFHSGYHPDADQLNAFIERVLPAHEQEETLAHLAICADCRAVVSLATPQVEEERTTVPMRRPWFSGWRLFWPAAGVAALAALVVLSVHIRNVSVRPIIATPAQVTVNHAPSLPVQVQEPQATPRPQGSPSALPASKLPARLKAALAPVPPGVFAPSSAPRGAAGAFLVRRGAMPIPESTEPVVKGSAAGAVFANGAGVAPNPNVAGRSLPQILPVNGRNVDSAPVASGTLAGKAAVAFAAPEMSTKLSRRSAEADAAEAILSSHPLPSGLPALSIISSERQTVAIDTHGALYLSDDSGAHWKPVPTQWSGRAVAVNLAASHANASRSFFIMKQAPGSSLQPGSRDSLDSAAAVAPSALSGTITDPSGAVIPGATVIVSASPTQLARAAKTDATGRYVVDGLAPGTYAVEAESPGFNARQVAGVAVAPDKPGLLNLILAIGAANEMVMVARGAAEVEPAMPLDEKRATPAKAEAPPVFEITTDAGEHWVSADGQSWEPK